MSERSERERGELIAEKVMGWHKGMVYTGYGEFVIWKDAKEQITIEPYDWHPESNIGQAMIIAEKLREMGYDVMLMLCNNGPYGCSYNKWIPSSKHPYRSAEIENGGGEADSLPKAICLAAEKVAEAMEAKE